MFFTTDSGLRYANESSMKASDIVLNDNRQYWSLQPRVTRTDYDVADPLAIQLLFPGCHEKPAPY